MVLANRAFVNIVENQHPTPLAERQIQTLNAQTSSEQSTRSLLDLITEAIESTRSQADAQGVQIGMAVDPGLPPYISVRRVDLPSIVNVVIRRALSVAHNTHLYLTIADAGNSRLLIQLEDSEGSQHKLGAKHWQQLLFWIEELGGEMTRERDVLLWNIALPLDAQSSATVRPGNTGLNILIASADTDVRARVVRYVRDREHSLIECRSHERALALCTTHHFDLIMLDSDLAGGGGLPLARTLHAAAPDQSLMALISTAIPTLDRDFDWVKLWMHKPPRDNELDLAVQVARNHRLPSRGINAARAS